MKHISILGILLILTAVFACSKPAVKQPPTPYAQYQLGMKYYNKGDNLKAQRQLQAVIYGNPGQIFVDSAQFYLAMTYYNIKSYPEAIGEFRKLLQSYPSSALAANTQYQIALSYYDESPSFPKDQTDTYSAIDEFGVFLDKYSDSPLLDDAHKKLNELYDKLAEKAYKSGELYLKLNDFDAALIYFGQVRDNYPSSEWAARAMFNSGVAQMKQKKNPDALQTFQDFVTAFPDNKLVKKAQQFIAKLTPSGAGG
jgi:outer membrane protein assembly factor BamD